MIRRPYMTINLSIAKNGRIEILMDSGATISLIKIGALAKNASINGDETIVMEGFADKKVRSLGTCVGIINFGNQTIEHIFHVVPNEVKLGGQDAILGEDFLRDNKVVLDFKNGFLHVNPKEIRVTSAHGPQKSILKKSNKNNILNKHGSENMPGKEDLSLNKTMSNKNKSKNLSGLRDCSRISKQK